MAVLIASDIHGSALYCEQLLDLMKKEKMEDLILLGDILYHGPRNDLPEGYAPKKVVAMLNPLKDHILCIQGNCDAEVDQMVLDFPIIGGFQIKNFYGRRLFLTHGHHYNIKEKPDRDLLDAADYVIYGHTHIPLKKQADGIWYLNPGSVSIPKEGSQRGCIKMTENEIQWLDLDGNVLDQIE